jgi:abequosyltransferase
MKTKLSICIPTYNRGPFLKVLLDSITSQANPDEVQIAIADNASSDQTMKLVENIRLNYPNIVYFRWQQNMGADRNYLKAVEIANGDYCWLMGSDDYVPAEAIKKMLARLKDADIYLIGRIEANFHLEKLQDRCWLNESEPDQEFDFSSKTEVVRYFNACRRLGGIFSYLSSIVVKRESWIRLPCEEKFIGTLYSHVYILISMVMNGCRLFYIKEPLIVSRAGNDSFLTDWVRRGLIDLRGYHQLGEALIPDLEVRRSFWGVMRYEHTPINILKSKAMSGWKDWPEYKRLAQDIYLIPRWVTRLAEILYLPARLAFFVKQFFKKNFSN